jgi:arylsulfatase A-like enzyme
MQYTRRRFLQQVGSAAGLAAVGRASGAAVARGRRPNIVHIVSDELGYYELSCMGHPHMRTPNIDRMAAQGVRFTQALAGSSVCAPTRCCLMTGKHSGHTSVRKNDGGTPLREGEETVASVLKRAGYATGGFGKWGCGGRGSTGVPEEHGFDVFVGYYDQVHAHSYYPAYIVRNSEELSLPGNRGGRSGQTYSHYVIVDEALKFIRANKDRPFFCYLPVTPPHGMFDIPDDDPAWQLYKDEPWPEEAKRYAAMVNMVDRNVGEVFALLKELGLDENTIVFFSGDNGGNDYFRDDDHPRGFHAPNVDPKTGREFRGHKGDLYEGGLRVPMLVRWPGRIEPGRVSDSLWYFPDVLPTVAELAGASAPDDIDGVSVVPELLGEAAGRKQEQHELLYWELSAQTAVRMGTWKAVQPAKNRDWELYDLSTDREEQNNLAAQHADVLAKMKALAEEAHEEAQEGIFHDRAIHEKDRRAKWGDTIQPGAAVNTLPHEGLIPTRDWKVARVSSESRSNGKLAKNAFDGDPLTWWHTEFEGGALEHPHELVIDLGREYTIRGFRYLARQDRGWNGAVKECEFHVGRAPDQLDTLAAKATFRKVKEAQEVKCQAVRGRYVLLRALSEVNGGPWASVAELGIVGEAAGSSE